MVETYDVMMVSNKESFIRRGLALVRTGYIAVQAKCSARQSGGNFCQIMFEVLLENLARVGRDKLQNRGIDFCGRCERPAHGLMLPDHRLDLPHYRLE